MSKELSLKLERRSIKASVSNFVKREEPDTNKVYVRMYAAVFNSMSEDLGGYKEIIDPHFFDDNLNDDVRCLFNHKNELILGRSSASTLSFGIDSTGLWAEYEDPGTTYSKDLLISLERGDIKECSFQFSVRSSSEGGYKFERVGDEWVCTLLKCERLYEVSPVTFPAYPETSIGKRGLEEAMKLLMNPNEKDFKRSIDRIKLLEVEI